MSRHTGIGSFQTHKVIVDVNGKKKRVPRDFGNPYDIVQLANTLQKIRKENGKRKFKEWIVRQAPWYKKKVEAKNG